MVLTNYRIKKNHFKKWYKKKILSILRVLNHWEKESLKDAEYWDDDDSWDDHNSFMRGYNDEYERRRLYHCDPNWDYNWSWDCEDRIKLKRGTL